MLKARRTPGPTACSKTKMLQYNKNFAQTLSDMHIIIIPISTVQSHAWWSHDV